MIVDRAPALRQVRAYGVVFESLEQRPTVEVESNPHAVRKKVTLKHPVGPWCIERLARSIADSRLAIRPNCAARTMVADIQPIVEVTQRVGIPIECACFIGSSPIRRYAEDWSVEHLQRCTEEAVSFDSKTPGEAIVVGDADELKAAVWNLVDNAVKYSPSGPKVNITLEETADHSRFALRVTDRGAGISPHELKRVFRRFYRIHGMAVRAKGSGLGLFIVRSVAKRHGCKAFAESEGSGRGSTFTILLPRAPEPV